MSSESRDIQIEIKGLIGTGKTAIAGLIINALKDTIPNCTVSLVEDGHPANQAFIKDLREKVSMVSPDEWFTYNVKIATIEIPEM